MGAVPAHAERSDPRKLAEIDARIDEFSHKWSRNRISRVALAVLRLAVYEMLYEEDIPYSVSINEAVELTKKFETVLPTTLEEALAKYEEEEPRGEYVLVLEGKSFEQKKEEAIKTWEEMTIEEHMAHYEAQGMDSKSAMKQVAKDRGVGKREIYSYLNR